MKKLNILVLCLIFRLVISFTTHLSAQQLSLFLREDGGKAMTNAYALTKDDESALHNAVISKQTYLSSYTRSQLYQQRLQFLSKQLQAYTSSSTPL